MKFLSRRRKKAGDFRPHKITILTASSRRKKEDIRNKKHILSRTKARARKFIFAYVPRHMDIDILYLSIPSTPYSRLFVFGIGKIPHYGVSIGEKATFQLRRNGLSDWNKAKSEESPEWGKKNDMSGIFVRN